MDRGTKRQSVEAKQAKGTYQSCRDKPRHLILAGAAPIMPNYLTPEAEDVWNEEFDRVVATGFLEADSSFFADYCCLAALTRAQWKAGTMPHAAQLTELRRRGEMLGIAGPASRALRGTAGNSSPENPFASLPEG